MLLVWRLALVLRRQPALRRAIVDHGVAMPAKQDDRLSILT